VRRPPRALLAAALVAALLAPAAWGVIPDAQKITNALTASNRKAGRGNPLLFDVTLRIGDSGPLATGVMATHPTGLARLELRSKQGFTERHLLQGSEYSASRDGRMLRSPRPFLPPIFLMQSTSSAALRAALASFGVSGGEVVLGLAENRDCYVLGGRLPRNARGEERRLPSMWIDMDSFDVVRVDRQDGVRFRFGPTADFDGVEVPSWITVEVPEQDPVRLDVEKVARANAPAAAFGRDWLLGAEGGE
jgi:hypothetical protein